MDNYIRQFDYDLPSQLVAQHPAHPRDHARLLIYDRRNESISDDIFYNLPNYLPKETTIVLNNSKVEKARLKFGAKEVFLTGAVSSNTVMALVFPGKAFGLNQTVELASGIRANVISVMPDGQRILRFNCAVDNVKLDKFRQTPFPPYIKANESLSEEYQTVYAKDVGSKAAPTAGLHFTPQLLEVLKHKWAVVELTLHIGLGTFAPLRNSQLASGTLHQERYQMDRAAAKELNHAEHITAVGTTTIRALESNFNTRFQAANAQTDIFIRPGYKFKTVDAMITNFHLPKSSLLMLVGAFMGVDAMQRTYRHAIAKNYRFYSFGDAMLVL